MKPALHAPTRGRLPRTVVIVGLVSLLNDFASEMVVPLIPLLLATVLAAGPVALGPAEPGHAPLSRSAGVLHAWKNSRDLSAATRS